MEKPTIALILPCFNEEKIIEYSINIIDKYFIDLKKREVINADSFVAIVDDGSFDNSWNKILNLSIKNPLKAIRFSRNFGHQYAVYAGIKEFHALADATITMDIDLQDDILTVEKMIELFVLNSNDIIYGIRDDRQNDSFFKKHSAEIYYRLLKLMKIDVNYNHADFRLSSNRVNNQLLLFQESNLFLRGIFPYMGFKFDLVHYIRKSRDFGESKYPLRKMLNLAWNGILSFSSYPLDLVFNFAIVSILLSAVLGIYILLAYLRNDVISGWTSITLIVSFFGSVQLLSIGILSKYLSKIFDQTKNRPRYIIQEKLI